MLLLVNCLCSLAVGAVRIKDQAYTTERLYQLLVCNENGYSIIRKGLTVCVEMLSERWKFKALNVLKDKERICEKNEPLFEEDLDIFKKVLQQMTKGEKSVYESFKDCLRALYIRSELYTKPGGIKRLPLDTYH